MTARSEGRSQQHPAAAAAGIIAFLSGPLSPNPLLERRLPAVCIYPRQWRCRQHTVGSLKLAESLHQRQLQPAAGIEGERASRASRSCKQSQSQSQEAAETEASKVTHAHLRKIAPTPAGEIVKNAKSAKVTDQEGKSRANGSMAR